MNKTCYICKHSVRIKWIRKYYGESLKEEELFCIVSPPCMGTGIQYEWKNITTGNSTLRKYRRYPTVSDVAICSLYSKTDKKKKIKDYEVKLEEDKKEQEIKQQKKIDDKKREKEYRDARKERQQIAMWAIKRKRVAEKARAKKLTEQRAKTKKERERIKARKEYQKQYRAKKKAEEKEKKNSYDRFEMMDL